MTTSNRGSPSQLKDVPLLERGSLSVVFRCEACFSSYQTELEVAWSPAEASVAVRQQGSSRSESMAVGEAKALVERLCEAALRTEIPIPGHMTTRYEVDVTWRDGGGGNPVTRRWTTNETDPQIVSDLASNPKLMSKKADVLAQVKAGYRVPFGLREILRPLAERYGMGVDLILTPSVACVLASA